MTVTQNQNDPLTVTPVAAAGTIRPQDIQTQALNWWDQPEVAGYLGQPGGPAGQMPGQVPGQAGMMMPSVQPIIPLGSDKNDPQTQLAAQQTADRRTAEMAKMAQQAGQDYLKKPGGISYEDAGINGFIERYNPYGGSNSS